MSMAVSHIDTGDTPSLAELLEQHRQQAARLVQSEAGIVLLRFESIEDLVQGSYCNALTPSANFEWRSEPEFVAWLFKVIRRHLGDRRDYWFAQKRNRGRLLRLTWGALNDDSAAHFGDIAASGTGPGTFAERREHLTMVTKAVSLLLPRDRELVRGIAEGLTIREQALRLNLSEAATARARSRALDRLRKVYTLISRNHGEHSQPPSR